MRRKKKERRSKRTKNSNRKTIGKGWNTQKTTRMGITERRRDGSLFNFPIPVMDFLGFDKEELKKNVKRVGANRNEKH